MCNKLLNHFSKVEYLVCYQYFSTVNMCDFGAHIGKKKKSWQKFASFSDK